jgi:hypothetical protein
LIHSARLVYTNPMWQAKTNDTSYGGVAAAF